MLWVEMLSSFGSSFIGHGLPRGGHGAASVVYSSWGGMAKSVRVASTLGWVTICTGCNGVGSRGGDQRRPGPEVGQINK